MDSKVIRTSTPNENTRIEITETDDYFHISCNDKWVHSFEKSNNAATAFDHANRMVGGMVMMIEFQNRTAE